MKVALETIAGLGLVRGSRLPKGREIPKSERKALFDTFAEDDKPVRGARDDAFVAVLYVCGLRRSEAVGLDLSGAPKRAPEPPPEQSQR